MVQKAQVSITLDNEQHQITVEPEMETILQAALDNGIDAPYSCMGGACSTCKAKLVEGTVEMDCNLILTDEELEDDFILACQSRPTSERVSIDFDTID